MSTTNNNAPTPEVEKLAKEIQSFFVSSPVWPRADWNTQKIAAILARAFADKDAEIEAAWAEVEVERRIRDSHFARAEKAEAGAEQYYQNWQSELASNSVRIKQRDEAIARAERAEAADAFSRKELARGNEIIDSLRQERDQLRAEVERLQSLAVNGAGSQTFNEVVKEIADLRAELNALKKQANNGQ